MTGLSGRKPIARCSVLVESPHRSFGQINSPETIIREFRVTVTTYSWSKKSEHPCVIIKSGSYKTIDQSSAPLMKGFKIIFYIILALSAMLTRLPPLTGTKGHRIWYRLYKERLFVCPPCFSLVEHLILILQRQRYTLSQIYICDISEKIPLLFLFVQCQIYSLHHVEIPQCHHTIPQPRYKSNIRSVFFSWGCRYVRLGGS